MPPNEHRCWGCGVSEDVIPAYGTHPESRRPVRCGQLCTDCSWEEHLAGMAHTGEFDEPKDGTPECCLRSRAATYS